MCAVQRYSEAFSKKTFTTTRSRTNSSMLIHGVSCYLDGDSSYPANLRTEDITRQAARLRACYEHNQISVKVLIQA